MTAFNRHQGSLYKKDSQRPVMHTLIFQNQHCVRKGLKLESKVLSTQSKYF